MFDNLEALLSHN